MKFKVFRVISSAFFQVYTSVYDTYDRHRRRSMCNSTSTRLAAALPVGSAGPAGVVGPLGAGRVAWSPAVAGVGLADVCEENRTPASFQFRIRPQSWSHSPA